MSFATLQPGTQVLGREGEQVGTVELVLADEDSGIFDGLVIDVRLGPGGLRFADAPQVEGIYQHAVVLTLSSSEVGILREPSANPAVMTHEGVEDSESALFVKLRRAWDLISGRY